MTQQDDIIEQVSGLLERAWLSGECLSSLPDACRPVDQAQAYRIQRRLAERLGPTGGWKVGAPSPDGAPHYAPLPARFLQHGSATCRLDELGRAILEAELAFALKEDLPPHEAPYGRDEVLSAVASVHAVIEIVDSRFRDWPEGTDKLSQLADLQNFGRLIVGEGQAEWSALDLSRVPASLTLDGALEVSAVGGNPAGDPVALLVWLANALPATGQWLRAGEVVTCGSCTGKTPVGEPVRATATFEGVGRVEVELV
ncbi:2-keto-4-pentenoate hydratase [Halomonas sp. MA07-2]|uniref:2-keto-4-pentenoate hydratase n=1 Tax=unclassified Halomonas TaxID=2609666 RepID=UPI003EE8B602